MKSKTLDWIETYNTKAEATNFKKRAMAAKVPVRIKKTKEGYETFVGFKEYIGTFGIKIKPSKDRRNTIKI